MPLILTANCKDLDLAKRFRTLFRPSEPLVPTNVPTACLLSGRKAKSISELMADIEASEVFVYWDCGSALRNTTMSEVISFWENREPWEDYDFCVFNKSLQWCLAITHNDYCILSTRQDGPNHASAPDAKSRGI